MNLPLLSPAALDNAVFELVARELGIANAMRFIARHNQPDGMDYTRDRENWLPQDAAAMERLIAEPDTGFDQLVAASKRNKANRKRKTE